MSQCVDVADDMNMMDSTDIAECMDVAECVDSGTSKSPRTPRRHPDTDLI